MLYAGKSSRGMDSNRIILILSNKNYAWYALYSIRCTFLKLKKLLKSFEISLYYSTKIGHSKSKKNLIYYVTAIKLVNARTGDNALF